jgi:CHRD domain-containing protein
MTPKTRLFLSFAAAAGLIGATLAAPVAEGGRKFVKSLTGQAELDGGRLTADMDGRGTAQVTVNVGQGRVCWNLVDLANLDPLVASHIHNAPATGQGPIKISFFNFGEPIDLEGCTEGSDQFPVDRKLLEDVVQHPENYYVNVHTSVFPGGAIRGQLSRGRQGS